MPQNRYVQLDTDEERLPEGMNRVGYDADTQVYTYKDADGAFWEGEEGNRYGELHPVGRSPPPSYSSNTASARQRYEDWRYLLPFFLVVGVFLLLVFHLVSPSRPQMNCGDSLGPYTVKDGDSCWAIAVDKGMDLDDLTNANPGLDCDRLMPEMKLCVPREG